MSEKMQELKEKFNTLLKEITDYADEAKESVSLSLGDAYNVGRSIGGVYLPKGSKQSKCEFDIDWQSSWSQHGDSVDEDLDGDDFILDSGVWEAWQSSSEQC